MIVAVHQVSESIGFVEQRVYLVQHHAGLGQECLLAVGNIQVGRDIQPRAGCDQGG